MKLERNFQINPVVMGVVPLVNVMFLVVLFFALSSRFLLQPGLAVSPPASSFALSPAHEPQLVTITAAPVPAIYLSDRRIALDELGPLLAALRGKERTVLIKADRTTSYDLLAHVINVALEHGFSVVLATSSEAR